MWFRAAVSAAAVVVAAPSTTPTVTTTFVTDPGARITIDGTVSGLHSGDYFFWVQDGKVNGGYGGHLSNPLSFDPSQP